MRAMNFENAASRVEKLLGLAQGMHLHQAQFTRQGIQLAFENLDQRVEVWFIPKIYPQGRVIIDAVNDLTLTVEVKRFSRAGESLTLMNEERLEMPYSLWFGEAYM